MIIARVTGVRLALLRTNCLGALDRKVVFVACTLLSCDNLGCDLAKK